MAHDVLVMGGTSFFGKRLVANLLVAGCNVTVATRGRVQDPFGDKIARVIFDRRSLESMQKAFGGKRFDIVFDQIGFGPDDIEDAITVFSGNIEHYVFTSSGSVYDDGSKITEEDFDPMSIKPGKGRYPEISYKDGKRWAEAYLFQNAPFTAAAARLPMVIGPDDVVGRTQFHVERVMKGLPIVVPRPRGKMAYLYADDTGKFISWLGLTRKTGPYNGASRYALDAAELIERIGEALGEEPIILEEGPEDALSPYATTEDFIMDPSKAEADGFVFTPFEEWFPDVVRETAELLIGNR